MSDPRDPDEDRMQAAEYALGLLTASESRAFESRLGVEPLLRAEYALWAEDLAALAAAVPAEPVPPAAFRAIEARLFPDERVSLWRRLGLVQAVLAAAVAAVLLLVVTNLGWLSVPPGPTLGAEIAAADQTLILQARFDPATATLTLQRAAGGVAAGRAHQLWLIAGDAVPLSLGLLADAGTTTLTLTPQQAVLLDGAVLAISDEPPGGSPTGQPTGAVLATGVIAAQL